MEYAVSIASIQSSAGPMDARIKIPGSKSYTNRALIIAALADGTTTIRGYSHSTDSLLLITILQKLGIAISRYDDRLVVTGNGGKFSPYSGTIDTGDSGTVMRFLISLCCLIPGKITLTGSGRIRERPVKSLINALIQLGAEIQYIGEAGFPPLVINGGKLKGGKVLLDGSESSQFLSSLLMIAPLLDSPLEINCVGEKVSSDYIAMTIEVMRQFGVSIEVNTNYLIKQGAYSPSEYYVEADASGASYFFALAALTKGTVTIENTSSKSLQGDFRFVDLLQQMGCKVLKRDNSITVTGPDELIPISADLKDTPDIAQTLAVVAAFANGDSIITGLKNLEIKETKRLTALQKELLRIGIKSTIHGGQIIIRGGVPHGELIRTYNDHRMAMSFGIAGARINGLQIESPEVVKKSFPEFWQTLATTGVNIHTGVQPMNIILIGYMGAGKSTVGKLLSEKTGMPLIETDTEILAQSGYASVHAIFEEKGESYFRALECDTINRAANQTNRVISCGGGVVMNYDNIARLRKSGKIIFLSATFETITKRLEGNDSRPLFNDSMMAKLLYQIRMPLYTQYADEIIKTDRISPSEVAEIIESITIKRSVC